MDQAYSTAQRRARESEGDTLRPSCPRPHHHHLHSPPLPLPAPAPGADGPGLQHGAAQSAWVWGWHRPPTRPHRHPRRLRTTPCSVVKRPRFKSCLLSSTVVSPTSHAPTRPRRFCLSPEGGAYSPPGGSTLRSGAGAERSPPDAASGTSLPLRRYWRHLVASPNIAAGRLVASTAATVV